MYSYLTVETLTGASYTLQCTAMESEVTRTRVKRRAIDTTDLSRGGGVPGKCRMSKAPDEEPPQLVPNWQLTPERPIAEYARHVPCGDHGAELHASYEVGVVLDGVMRRNHGAGWFDVHGGQAWIVAAFQAHWWASSPQGYRRIIFAILPSFMERLPSIGDYDLMRPFLTSARLGPIGADRSFSKRLGTLANEILANRPENGIFSQGQALFDILRVLPVIAQHILQTQSTAEACLDMPPPRESVYSALKLIEKDPARRISLDEAARACGMGRSLFATTFRASMGVSFAQFQRRSRLALAAGDIRHTDIPLKAIAAQYGFADFSHLSKCFSQHYHTTPAEYRKGNMKWTDPPSAN